MDTTLVKAYQHLIASVTWNPADYLRYAKAAKELRPYCYFQRGEFHDLLCPLDLCTMVCGEYVPVSREAKAAALIEAYQQQDGSLVLANGREAFECGILFHPSTSQQGMVQATSFDRYGFFGHQTYGTLIEAVMEYTEYRYNGLDLLRRVFGKSEQ